MLKYPPSLVSVIFQGYFSITTNQIIGDKFYSLTKDYNHKVIDRKIIIGRRGIYTTIGIKGKGMMHIFNH